MPDSQSDIIITFKGISAPLEEATAKVRAALVGTGTGATEAGRALTGLGGAEAKAGAEAEHLAGGERHAKEEARGLAAGVKIAAESVGLLGIESGESVGKVFLLRDAMSELRAASSSWGAAALGGGLAIAGFATLDFLRESVKEGMAGEAATARLNAALAKTPELARTANEDAERGATTWAKYGVTVGALKSILAQGVGAHLSTDTILGNPRALADLAIALRTDIPSALAEITHGARGAQAVLTRLNLTPVQLRQARYVLNDPRRTQDQNAQYLLALAEKGGFAGQADAQAKSAAGSFTTLNATLSDLRETVGMTLVPALAAMAQGLTGALNSANHFLSGVGGLGAVLKTLWLPILGLALVAFTGLRGIVMDLAGKLVGTIAGAFGTTTQAMVEGEQEALRLGDAIKMIPPDVTTTAFFNDTAAKAEKDGVYIPDIRSIPTSWTTVAAFDATAARAGVAGLEQSLSAIPAPAPIAIPVSYGALAPLVEATPATVTVPVIADVRSAEDAIARVRAELGALPAVTIPVTADTAAAETAITRVQVDLGKLPPLNIPVVYDTKTTFVEATPHALTVPVVYDTTHALVEATPHPLRVPVTYDTTNAFHEASAVPIKAPVVMQADQAIANLQRDLGRLPAVTIPVTANAAAAIARVETEVGRIPASERILIPVTTGDVNVAKVEREINAIDVYGKTHPVIVPVETSGSVRVATSGETLAITPILDPRHATEMAGIRSTLQREAGGVTVPVTPRWIAGAGHLLGQSLAVGAAVGITDAIFQSVKIDHLTAPTGKVVFDAKDATRLDALQRTLADMKAPVITLPKQQHVVVDNIGAVGSALGGGKTPGPTAGANDAVASGLRSQISTLQGIKADAKIYQAQSVKYQQATAGALTLPGGITVKIGSLDAGAIAGMAIAVAAGNVAANAVMGILGKIGGPIIGAIANLFKRAGGGDGPGGGGPYDILGDAEKVAQKAQGGTPVLSGLGNAAGALKNAAGTILHSLASALASAAGSAFKGGVFVADIAVAVGGVLLGAFKLIGALFSGGGNIGTALVGLRTGLITSIGQMFSGILAGAVTMTVNAVHAGQAIVTNVLRGIAAGAKDIVYIGQLLITNFLDAIISLVNAAISHIPGISGRVSIPYVALPKPPPDYTGSKAAPLPSQWQVGGTGSWGGGKKGGGLTEISPEMAAALRGIVATPASTAAERGRANTTHTVTNHNVFNINGAKDPKAVSAEVLSILKELEQGVADVARSGGGSKQHQRR